ncbi:MAG TPA: hypothetical protein VKV26_18955 [Dehalococcoidia bacterium]|nr:hypothetical protein [Dehalococcoidia bacterium]
MAKHLFVVLSNAVAGQDEAFNTWYTERHLGDILKIPGYVAAQRFKLSETQLSEDPPPYGYLALYEVEADNVEEARRAMAENVGGGLYIDPSIDLTPGRTVAWFYSPITERLTTATAQRSEQTVP